ncbi:hypothetical protein QC823_11725 [Halomonas vilamensis]|uniref:Uncharacterized protein n=1 Tax=Vreelandella vilamensis TaxID=531309 RepID=A0ABU1H808_9GAMM|nr:DUF6586 family protein [Halomonas vilamensis]MDR5899653.1 hypothetical protein [Halomonas vilamensis]
MTPRARTNQLLYQAELLITTTVADDEDATSRKMALEESALALMELALESHLKEVTEHARLVEYRWPLLLAADGPAVAELQRLRDLAADVDSWLGWLIFQLERLHSSEGASKRPTHNPSMIALGSQAAFADEMLACINSAKNEIAALRETSEEW